METKTIPKLITQGSVRIDISGGTLDLAPINLLFPNTITINLAIDLKAQVSIQRSKSSRQIKIHSLDYESEIVVGLEEVNEQSIAEQKFGPLSYIIGLLFYAGIREGVEITLSSGSPAGAGLGGSSSMGVTFLKAINQVYKLNMNRASIIALAKEVEAIILAKGPTGYQDYYPALYGGVLALKAKPTLIEVEQLFDPNLKSELESEIILAYSGQTRKSGFTNWEVYKRFFDDDDIVVRGLKKLHEISEVMYKKIKKGDFKEIKKLIKKEGETRRKLFPKIETEAISHLRETLENEIPDMGFKMCGAGGGGCFIVMCSPENRAKAVALIEQAKMRPIDFRICSPLNDKKENHE